MEVANITCLCAHVTALKPTSFNRVIQGESRTVAFETVKKSPLERETRITMNRNHCNGLCDTQTEAGRLMLWSHDFLPSHICRSEASGKMHPGGQRSNTSAMFSTKAGVRQRCCCRLLKSKNTKCIRNQLQYNEGPHTCLHIFNHMFHDIDPPTRPIVPLKSALLENNEVTHLNIYTLLYALVIRYTF